MTSLLITVRFLDDRYHGLLARDGPPEWPPSPFRLFSAFVSGVAQLGELDGAVGESLVWLQELCCGQPPIIIAPRSCTGQAIVRYGPDNDDKFHTEPEKCRSGKPTIPTLMLLDPDQNPEVHYLWDIEDRADVPMDRLRDACCTLTTLGWGVDMAFADVRQATEAGIQKIKGVRWYPKPRIRRDTGMLRVPTSDIDLGEDTLSDLRLCYQAETSRISHGKPKIRLRKSSCKPRVFDQVCYASVERPIGRPYITFELRNRDNAFFQYSQRKLVHLAGMVRHLAIETMKKSPPRDIENADEWIDRYVAGHARDYPGEHHQFSYLPLPSIGHAHADQAVRRVMISAPVGDDRLLEHLARRLAGEQPEPERGDEFGFDKDGKPNPPPTLIRVRRDKVAACYTRAANTWASVTPVILPGHNDHKPAKTVKLIEKALRQSGIEQRCTFEWRAISWFSKSLTAHKFDCNKKLTGYIRPDHLLSQTAVHLKLQFDDGLNVPGPLMIGAGRHCGLGLMAGLGYKSERR